jgi:uncharacterized repeat protein (TIGR03843 family)
MVQRFVDHDPEEHYFTLLEEHEDRFRQFAVFDVLVNNADRKGGHCLSARQDGHIWGIDHGLTFHPHDKLRTVIWDFAGERVPVAVAEEVCRMADDVERGGELGLRFAELLSPVEVAAFVDRARSLVRVGVLPQPDPGYHSVPWPLV